MRRVSYPCMNSSCGKKVVKGIACDVCNGWMHAKCSGIPSACYQLYAEHEGLEWVCGRCKLAARNALGTVDTTQQGCMGTTRVYADASQISITNKSNTHDEGIEIRVPSPQESAPRPLSSRKEAPVVSKRPTPSSVVGTLDEETGWRPSGRPQNKSTKAKKAPEKIDLEKKIQELAGQVNFLRQEGRTKGPERHKNLLILNREEPLIKEAKARRDIDRRRVYDILRMVGFNQKVHLKRVHRIGKWRPTGQSGPLQTARPILVEFADSRARDYLLSRAKEIEIRTGKRYKIVPDNGPARNLAGKEELPRQINLPKPTRGPWPRVNAGIMRPILGPKIMVGPLPRVGASVGRPILGAHKQGETRKPTPDLPVVVIEDVLEDEAWQSCTSDDDEPTKCGGMTSTPICKTSEPTNSKSRVDGNMELTKIIEEEADKQAKNVVSPRVLRPRIV